jgi:uncharacterized membrane-anchored protein
MGNPMRKTLLAASVAALLLTASVAAQDAAPAAGDSSANSATPSDASDPRLAQAKAFLAKLNFQQGNIAVPGTDAHFDLGADFRYLDKNDADQVLEHFWRNPHDDAVLGMVVPAGLPLTDDHSWAVVITRTDEGHIADDDAAKTDYAELLKKMQEGDKEENEERKKAGYPEINLVGWAETPRYDAANKKLYWARELSSPGAEQHTLNYDIRILGRTGYISLNAVAGMNDIATVRTGMQQLLPKIEFDTGKRYADFDPSHDHLAAYGIAALVAGGIAAKAGLFAKIGVILLALKKFVIFIIAGIAAGIKKLFGGKDKNKPGPTVQ